MAAQFKNVITEIDTTGSAQTLLTCPAGKTILIRTFHVANEDGSNASYYASIKDNSEDSSNSFPIFDFQITADNAATNINPIILEESDVFYIQTDQDNQHVYVAYVELDSGTIQRYRAITKNLTTADATATILTCPTGSTIIINYMNFFNNSGASAAANSLTVTDSSASATKVLLDGTVADQASAGFAQAIVLESGDAIKFYPDTQPHTAHISYLEIRNPPIRA